MSNYLSICQDLTPYLVALVGILFFLCLSAFLLYLLAALVELAWTEWVKRFKVTLHNLGVMEEFKIFMQERKLSKRGDRNV